ncbi:Holliday junction resolvase RuvX [Hominenteromicrobium sp.]|uniref:Holliday junction resolvase RuvX n=1 Tax=Hominenteromicrobium sp. TaxID=3073581 RepID=UPI003A931383
MVILGVDLGKARTGVAVCDKSELLASPVEVVNEHNRERLLERVAQLAKARRAEQIVVGLPRNMDGSEGESAQNARAFGAELAEKTRLPVDFSDERGTTITAHGFLNETNTRGKRRKATVDAVAATIILQDYLDYRRNRKG